MSQSETVTVQVLVNGQVLYARSATNTTIKDRSGVFELQPIYRYKSDTGELIIHNQNDGVISLSQKLLATIKEP